MASTKVSLSMLSFWGGFAGVMVGWGLRLDPRECNKASYIEDLWGVLIKHKGMAAMPLDLHTGNRN